MNDLDTTMRDYEREREARAKLSQATKDAVFDALAAANITQVLVEFDGEGDGGQMNSVTAFRNEEPVEFPAVTVAIRQFSGEATEPVTAAPTLEGAIESLCYDYLEETHGGWEINEGSYGDFRIDVAKRTIELEFNGRFIGTDTSNHTF